MMHGQKNIKLGKGCDL